MIGNLENFLVFFEPSYSIVLGDHALDGRTSRHTSPPTNALVVRTPYACMESWMHEFSKKKKKKEKEEVDACNRLRRQTSPLLCSVPASRRRPPAPPAAAPFQHPTPAGSRPKSLGSVPDPSVLRRCDAPMPCLSRVFTARPAWTMEYARRHEKKGGRRRTGTSEG